MTRQFTKQAAAIFATCGLAASVTLAQNEVEPNETKATATAITLPAGGGAAAIVGASTGTSVTAGATSLDQFLLTVPSATLGIYRHNLTITTAGTAGHTGTIRGLNQTNPGAGFPGVAGTTDTTVQSSSTLTTPTRSNVWFGFGKNEQLYYRVTGLTTTTANYSVDYSVTPVTPIAGPSSIVEGAVTISTIGQTADDTDFWLYDSNLNAVPLAGCDDESVAGGGTGVTTQGIITRTLTPGTYYLAMSRFNFANNQVSPADEDFKTGAIMDFPNVAVSSSTTTAAADFDVSIGGAPVTVLGAAATGYDVQWVQFTVIPASGPTPPAGSASSSPTSVNNCGTSTALLTVAVTPGNNPVSTGITVTGDLTNIGGSSTQTFVDNGTGGDAVAGDNIFSYTATVPNTVTVGAKTLSYAIADAQGRTASAGGSLGVTTCPPSVPPCPVGTSVVSGANLDSVGAIGAGNGIVTNTVSGLGTVNKIHVSGLIQEINVATYASEARLRVTTPAGTQYNFQFSPDIAFPIDGTYLSIADQSVEIPAESGDGVWTAEVFESFDDTGIDSRWLGLCVTAENTSTQPQVNGIDWSVDLIAANLVGPFASGSSSSVLSATVVPGGTPTSTGLVVTADLSGLGGSATAAMNDGGLNGDAVAGDGIYSLTFTATGSTPTGAIATPIAVSDDQARSASGTVNLSVGAVVSLGSVNADTDGLLVSGANVAAGEIKWYSFELCNDVDAAQSEWFDIHTNGSVLGDTEIGLYDASGNLVSSDDDSGLGLKSFLTYGTGSGADIDGADSIDVSDGFNGALLAAGTYYLSVGDFNVNFGATAFGAVATGVDAGTVDITFDTNNSCSTLPTCGSIDFNGDGLFPDDSDLVDFLAVLAGGECSTGTCDTIDFNRDELFPDDNDLVDFLTVLAGGTPTNCTP